MEQNGTLFAKDRGQMPLAERLRPKDFADFVGQEHITGEGKPLREAIERDALPSLILWGPPGSGKTTLARIIAEKTKAAFVHFSAAEAGVPQLKSIIAEAGERLRFYQKRTILFVDEIHHFSKSQQAAFLPAVEDGTIVLIGATTENPSFEIISPLLSRSLVLVLNPLTDEALAGILERALADTDAGLGASGLTLTPEARDMLVGFADGDARTLLNGLEFAAQYVTPQHRKAGKSERFSSPERQRGVERSETDDRREDAGIVPAIDAPRMREILSRRALRYDKKGEEHYNVISAFIKSMRDSDPQGALYWLARMVEAGEDPRFIARRMIIFASEDVGNADPQALSVAVAAAQAVERVGMPEAAINLAHGTTYLATAPKSNASYKGLLAAMRDAKEHGALGVPLHLRNAVTNLMKDLGYGQGYQYAHEFKNAEVRQTHLPEELEGRVYYRPENLDKTASDPLA